ncbi:MAG: TIGR02147 family protein [Fibrobacteria bacterium]|nr:TIGR02147 family protein [Fibrobacteria bacterium]
MKNIFEYLDYRAFLREYYEEEKSHNSGFTIRYLANEVGMTSSYTMKVLNGQVHLGVGHIESFSTLFKLDRHQAEYFEELVYFGRAKKTDELDWRFKKLQRIKGVEYQTIDDHAVEFFRNWYNAAVRSLISIHPFNGRNFRSFGAKLTPSIKADQAKEAFELLVKLGMIKKNAQGIYKTTEQFLSTTEKWMSPVIRDYQLTTLELTKKALKRFPKEERDISTMTVALSWNEMPALREIIKKFRREVLQLSKDIDDYDNVMQINVQAFPVVDLKGDKK